MLVGPTHSVHRLTHSIGKKNKYIGAPKEVANRETLYVCLRVQHRGSVFYTVFIHGSGDRVGQPCWSH